MSRFVTTIQIDVHGLLALLPRRATPLDVRFNPSTASVEVEWDDDDLVTPYSFPVEYSREQLEVGQVPDKVRVRPGADVRPAKGRRFDLGHAERVLEGEQRITRVEVTRGPDVATPEQAPVEGRGRKAVKGRS